MEQPSDTTFPNNSLLLAAAPAPVLAHTEYQMAPN